ncbi:MAG: UdgX family uracil-DNA binding protein [Caulobacteraceae bacterium]
MAGPTDIAGWRAAARRLCLAEAPPETIRWQVGVEAQLFAEEVLPVARSGAVSAPRALVDLAEDALLHRADDRFDLMYRLLLRSKDEPGLLGKRVDPAVARAFAYQKQVRQAEHHMHAFVRFRQAPIGDEDGAETYAAWIDPPHYVVEKAVPFFIRRLANARFSIASPYVSAVWNGASVSYHPGVGKPDIPRADASEADWRVYFAATFNPARLNSRLMVQHMPRRYWRGLPEAEAIPQMVADAGRRAETMVAASATAPSVLAGKLAARTARIATVDSTAPAETIGDLAAAITECRRCPLHRDATQAVRGEGPAPAAIMIVGEQPGDIEDLRGRPFIGPAGTLLDACLEEAGVSRGACYVTNAVKHFKHERRGKRRIHRSPDAGDIAACGDWLQAERRLVRPRVILALGATAGRALLGRPISVLRERGAPIPLSEDTIVIPSLHPAYVLRLANTKQKAEARAMLTIDLATAARLSITANYLAGDGDGDPRSVLAGAA